MISSAVPILAQEDDLHFTLGMTNGRGWILRGGRPGTYYISALRDAMFLAALELESKDRDVFLTERWAEGFSVGDYKNELDLLYKDGENLRIPIVMAID